MMLVGSKVCFSLCLGVEYFVYKETTLSESTLANLWPFENT